MYLFHNLLEFDIDAKRIGTCNIGRSSCLRIPAGKIVVEAVRVIDIDIYPQLLDADLRNKFIGECITDIDVLETEVGTALEPEIRHGVVVVLSADDSDGIVDRRILLGRIVDAQ